MKVIFYKNNSENTTVNKTLTAAKEKNNIIIKHEIDTKYPTLVLDDLSMLDYNYCYIPSFKRYFYFQNVKFENGNRCTVDLKVDVLMSFKTQINNAVAFIERCESPVHNKYINDPLLPIKTTRKLVLKEGNFVAFSSTLKNYLCVTGGGVE